MVPSFYARAADLLDLFRRNLPVEKLDANSRASTGNLGPFDVGDPAGEDSFGGLGSCDSPGHPQKYLNRQTHKYGLARHKVNSSRRYIHGFRWVTICQRRVHRTKHQGNLPSVAVCIATFRSGHGRSLRTDREGHSREFVRTALRIRPARRNKKWRAQDSVCARLRCVEVKCFSPLPRPVFRFGGIKNVAPSPRVAVLSASHTARTALRSTRRKNVSGGDLFLFGTEHGVPTRYFVQG